MENKLESIGLTHNESIVYLSLLKIGTSKTGKILNESKLNSGKIYEILESLKDKGLVSESIINNVRHFTAASPEQLLKYINKKKESLGKDERTVKQMLPDLEKIHSLLTPKTRSVTYTGLRGIMTAVDEASAQMKTGEELLAVGLTKNKDPKFNKFWIKWSKDRVSRKLKARYIMSEKSEYSTNMKKQKNTQVKILPAVTQVTFSVYPPDKLLIVTYEDPSCILIQSKATYYSFKQFFNQLWKIAK
jgi:sugar-specific transcriptional regulator TrmB